MMRAIFKLGIYLWRRWLSLTTSQMVFAAAIFICLVYFITGYNIIHSEPQQTQTFSRHHASWLITDSADSDADREDSNVPDKSYAINRAVIVWCSRNQFQFKDYLSFLSVLKTTNVQHLAVYLEHVKKVNHSIHYNTWFEELQQKYPAIHVHQPPRGVACLSTSEVNKDFIFQQFKKFHRESVFYFSTNVILSNMTEVVKNSVPKFATSMLDELLFLYKPRGILIDERIMKSQTNTSATRMSCSGANAYTNTTFCAEIASNYLYNNLYPEDLFLTDTDFSRLCKQLMFNNKWFQVNARPYQDSIIPNIAHVVNFNGDDLVSYYSVLSLIYVLKIKHIILYKTDYHDGPYYKTLRKHSNVESEDYPDGISVDEFRAIILVKYGGLFINSDVIFLQPLQQDIMFYETVASLDWEEHGDFPNSMNLDVTMAKPGSRFFQQYYSAHEDLNKDGVKVASRLLCYKIYEHTPWLIHMQTNLQVKCDDVMTCYPAWRQETNVELYDWRTNSTSVIIKDVKQLHKSGIIALIDETIKLSM